MFDSEGILSEGPLGDRLPGWEPVPIPTAVLHRGRYARLEKLSINHAVALYDAFTREEKGQGWTYLPYGPFDSQSDFDEWLQEFSESNDPSVLTVIDENTGLACGLVAYLRIQPEHGSIEVGHIHFSTGLRGTRAATEAIYLLMEHVFDLGYRRLEWKCDALNRASRAAALRFGFSYEGTFRQAAVVKGRNRDTAWFAMIDREWPLLRKAFKAWLAPRNFDANGQQREKLAAARAD